MIKKESNDFRDLNFSLSNHSLFISKRGVSEDSKCNFSILTLKDKLAKDNHLGIRAKQINFKMPYDGRTSVERDIGNQKV